MASLRLALLTLLAAACGNGGAGATFNGTVKGQALQPVDAISSPATVTIGGAGTAAVLAISLSDATRLCSKLGTNVQPAGAKALLLFLSDVNLSTGSLTVPTGTGVYTVYLLGQGIPPAHAVVAAFGANDAACKASSVSANAGSVTLTSNSGGATAGSYDLTFESGDRATGTFNTAACPSFATYLATTTHTCG